MIGPISFDVKLQRVINGEVDVAFDKNNTGNLIISTETGATDTLLTISNARAAGQLLILQGVEFATITLKDSTSSGTAWVTATGYVLGDILSHNSILYSCKLAHTSSSSTEPAIGATWETVWFKGNIETLDGADFSLADDDNIILKFDNTDNKWQQLTSGKQGIGGGGGTASFPLNYPVDRQGNKTGTVTHSLTATTAHKLKFTATGDCDITITGIPTTSSDAIDFYIEVIQDSTGNHVITFNDSEWDPIPSFGIAPDTVSLISVTADGNGKLRPVLLLNVTTNVSGATQQLDNLSGVAINTSLISDTDNTDDLGSALVEWKDLFIDGTAKIDTLIVDVISTFSGTANFVNDVIMNGDITLGNASTDTIFPIGSWGSHLIPSTDNARDIGSTLLEWRDLFIDGTAKIDTLIVDVISTFNGTSNAFTNDVIFNGTTAFNSNATMANTVDLVPVTDLGSSLGSATSSFSLGYFSEIRFDYPTKFIASSGALDLIFQVPTGGDMLFAENGTPWLQLDGGNNNVVFSRPVLFDNDVTLGNAVSDTLVATGQWGSHLIPIADDTYDLGGSGEEWRDLYIDGTGNIDSLNVDLITSSVTFTGSPVNFNSALVNFGDSPTDETVFLGMLRVPVDTNATRSSAGTAGRIIFNTDDGQLNIDNGTSWTLPDGTTT